MSGVGAMGMAEPPDEEFADFCHRGLANRHNRLVERLGALDAREISPHWWQAAGRNARFDFSPLAMADNAMDLSYRQGVDFYDVRQRGDRTAVVATIERWLVDIQDAERWTFEAERLVGEANRLAKADAKQAKKKAERYEMIYADYDNRAAKPRQTKVGLVQLTVNSTGCPRRTIERALAERRKGGG